MLNAPGMEKSASAGVGDLAQAPKSKEAVEPKVAKAADSTAGAADPRLRSFRPVRRAWPQPTVASCCVTMSISGNGTA